MTQKPLDGAYETEVDVVLVYEVKHVNDATPKVHAGIDCCNLYDNFPCYACAYVVTASPSFRVR
jgi:hypothetical protein